MFRIVKRYYERGIYGKEDVKTFVMAGMITSNDYETITGELYIEPK